MLCEASIAFVFHDDAGMTNFQIGRQKLGAALVSNLLSKTVSFSIGQKFRNIHEIFAINFTSSF